MLFSESAYMPSRILQPEIRGKKIKILAHDRFDYLINLHDRKRNSLIFLNLAAPYKKIKMHLQLIKSQKTSFICVYLKKKKIPNVLYELKEKAY